MIGLFYKYCGKGHITGLFDHQFAYLIEGIQNTTEDTVVEISKITSVISEVNEIVTTIATAVDGQTIATKEIADNVGGSSQSIKDVNRKIAESADASQEITHAISDVSLTITDIAGSSEKINTNVNEMNQLAAALSDWVEKFKICIGMECKAEDSTISFE